MTRDMRLAFRVTRQLEHVLNAVEVLQMAQRYYIRARAPSETIR